MCPQCLSEINLEGFERAADDRDYLDDEELGQNDYTREGSEADDKKNNDTQPTASNAKTTAQPPAYKPQANTKQPTDDVLRYCKSCGTFLRKGVNFCPKCGKYVKVAPPTYQPTKSQQVGYKQQNTRPNANYGQYNDPRNRVRPPMANKVRKPSQSKRYNPNEKGKPTGIFSIMGCLIFTVIVVALFFILYIVLGVNVEG